MRLRYCSVEMTSSFLMLVISLISLRDGEGEGEGEPTSDGA